MNDRWDHHRSLDEDEMKIRSLFDEDVTDEEEIKIKGLFDDDDELVDEKQQQQQLMIIPSLFSIQNEESNFDDWNFNNSRASMLIRLLPPEIHYLILTFVDFKTLLTCQLVSKQWYDFASREEIWYPFYGHMIDAKSLRNIVNQINSTGGLTVNDFTIYDKDGIALVPRQQHLSEEYLSWMLQEREAEDNETCVKTTVPSEKATEDHKPSYRSLFLNKAVHKYEKKLRKKDLIEMYNTLNKFVQYLPMLKKICYLFFSIGILIFSLILPLLLENDGNLKDIEYLGNYYSTYVLVCYGPVFFSHACCLAFCYYVYRTHVNLSYHDQNERLLIFSMTNVTSYLLDVTFETQLLCSIPLVFCIPIIMHIFDWGHTVSMIPVVIAIMIQKLFYFIYEVQREKILKRKKWETLQESLACVQKRSQIYHTQIYNVHWMFTPL
ncbi:hypothetical protein FDP41_010380 [Naegleria fowleri]|uniref:F-box domain-containing protein n=1 Tax=Naegleria fowleri TaxID=5763 RepID=A0A6A5CD87_NAEFO|nr:uncharacterized protein FDP41_010380 [Naegleria fowleri]KAF0983315.1 hypothetical protein FDP41_010380 [Naegleria fowleri]CAG4709108.1 unnamed protein product [Naegleria fowleri]